MTGPSWRPSTWRSRATSSASAVSGNCGAATWYPSDCRRSMTPLQLEPSAHAPWTSTMFGRAFISVLPPRSVLPAILRSEARRAVCVTSLHFGLALLHEQRLGDLADEPAGVGQVGVGESDAVVTQVGTAGQVHPFPGRRPQQGGGHGRRNREPLLERQ